MDPITKREFFIGLGCLAIAVGARLPIGTNKEDFYYRFKYELLDTVYWTSGTVSWSTFLAVVKTHLGYSLTRLEKVPALMAEQRHITTIPTPRGLIVYPIPPFRIGAGK